MSLTITRCLEIDVGHRLVGHEGKCRNAHGHRYSFEVEFSPFKGVDGLGRVIDFSVVKEVLGGWLDHHWDHGFLFGPNDPIGEWLIRDGQKCFAMPAPPTAEAMATYFLAQARSLMADYEINVVSVKLYETPNCWATAR